MMGKQTQSTSREDDQALKNAIDHAAHEIQQMVAVLTRSVENLAASDKDPEVFQMPATDADLLWFSISDIERRVFHLSRNLTGGRMHF